MMHKVKDVMSKIFHPSFLLSGNDDPDRPKRKRSGSPEELSDEPQIDRTPRMHRASGRRSASTDDEPQLTDDEDNNSRDVPSTEQQTKRRRTANYQRIISTNQYCESERTPPSSIFTESVISSSHTTPTLRRTPMEQNYTERISRSQQRLHLPLPYRRVVSDYDPLKSPLFSASNRNSASVPRSNDVSANHLLATSLINPSSPSRPIDKPPVDTLRNPVFNERRMLGAHYSSISSRRLPYIERLRRRTLQDSIRLDRAPDNEPLSTSTTAENRATTTSSAPERVKASEKECGVQCDITVVEPVPESQRTFPPADIRKEALLIPAAVEVQTASSITIERSPTTMPVITKPKVLGEITPFSWPKFARAQTEYANKYPEKCRADALVPSTVEKANTPSARASPSRTTESTWKCPCCTKEHTAQTATCSLCHGINPNYKKPSATQPSATVAKEQGSSSVTAKEAPIAISTAPMTNSTITITTKENLVSATPPIITTSTISNSFPSVGTAPLASSSVTTKESSVTTTTSSSTPIFGLAPLISRQSTVTTTAAPFIGFTMPTFGVTSAPTTTPSTTASLTSTTTSRSMFGTLTTAPAATATTATSATTTTAPFSFSGGTTTRPLSFGVPTTTVSFPFGVTTTKENSITISRLTPFGASSSDNSLVVSQSNPTPIAPLSQPFASTTPVSPTTTMLGSTGPSLLHPTSNPTASTAFGSFGNKAFLPSASSTPMVSAVSFSPLTPSTAPVTTSAPSITANNSTTSNLFAFLPKPPSSTLPTSLSLSAPVSIATTTSGPPAFGITGGFSVSPASTSSAPTDTLLSLNASSPPKRFAPAATSPMNTNSAPPFGAIPTFGATSMPVHNPFANLASSNPTPLFNFGSTFNPPPASVASTTSVVGGFPFGGPSLTTAPAFGAAPSSFSSSPFSFGIGTSVPTNPPPFPFSTTAATSSANPPDISDFPSSTVEDTALFTIGSGDTRSDSPRRILRAKRRDRDQ